ncbi:M23 family metallopeptidase [Alkalihalobacillus trypoxylicola]|uniref:LysM domain-containing protein n=1 Tax=Alkalihalobacillus trypoxylicola TaxID=519424 RepID=A0A162EKW4_9BACI|nr:M23 family metallopeptidase [Alkalihalobacillus trypoxylicola]KYG33148.1 hypothetical protein AZF04_17535 [Alkalihalobacillus trypoxylicola]
MLDLIKRLIIAFALALFIGILFLGANSPVAKAEEGNHSEYPIIWPTVGQLTDTYGTRGGTHYGIDIAAPEGTPVIAVEGGKVSRSYYSSSYGNVIFIKHNHQDIETVYAHLHQRFVEEGETVEKKDLIGTVGNTGRSSGNHLHFEMHYDEWDAEKSNSFDPLTVLGSDHESMYAALGHAEGDVLQTMSSYLDEEWEEEKEDVEQQQEVEEEQQQEKEVNQNELETEKETIAIKETEEIDDDSSDYQPLDYMVEEDLVSLLELVEHEQMVERTVKKNDSLWAISKEYDVTIEDLKKWNQLKDDVLQIGQELVVYENPDNEYIVKAGDTLTQIAYNHQITVEVLFNLNHFESDLIHPGMKLIVQD